FEKGKHLQVRQPDQEGRRLPGLLADQFAAETEKEVEKVTEEDVLLEETFMLFKIESLSPKGVEIKNVEYGVSNKVIVTGHADQRKQVIALQEALENDRMFLNVESPLSNLLKAEDIDFKFTITLSEKDLNIAESQICLTSRSSQECIGKEAGYRFNCYDYYGGKLENREPWCECRIMAGSANNDCSVVVRTAFPAEENKIRISIDSKKVLHREELENENELDLNWVFLTRNYSGQNAWVSVDAQDNTTISPGFNWVNVHLEKKGDNYGEPIIISNVCYKDRCTN
ncbi:MAG: hypothetical protein R3346_04445, partial [Candidatus Spechtbacterales bacterium]|nr:hypothetical protein [Candidatus Spechtbacterales bacterium]